MQRAGNWDHKHRIFPTKYSRWMWVSAVLVLAFLWRAIFPSGGTPNVDYVLRGDEGNYFGLARSLLETGNFADKWPWIRPPLYPLVLAFFLSMGHGDLLPMQLFQAAIGALTALVAYLAANIEYGPKAARLAGVILALDPTAPVASQYLFAEGLTTFLTLAALTSILAGLKNRQLKRFAVAGFFMGLGLLSRASVLPFVFLLALWTLCRREWRLYERIAVLGLFFAVLAACLAPWTIRNWLAYQRFILLDTTLGVNLYQHNTDLTRTQVYSDLMRISNPGDRESYGVSRAIEWIVGHPRQFALRALDRLRYSWTVDRYREWGIYLRSRFPAVASWVQTIFASVGTVWYLALTALAAVGLGLVKGSSYRTMTILLIAGQTATAIFIEPVFRYKLAFLPYVVPLVSAVPWHLRWDRSLLFSAIAPILLIVLSLSLLFPAWSQDLAAHTVYTVGRAAEAAGMTGLAERAFLKAIGMKAQPDFYLALGRLLGKHGATTSAFRFLGQARGIWLEDPRIGAWQVWLTRQVGLGMPPPDRGPVALWAETWSWDHLPVPPRSSLHIGTDDLGYVRGFYGPETSGGLSYRWTGARAQVRLWAPSSRVRLKVLCASTKTHGTTFRLYLSGAPIGTAVAMEGDWRWQTLEVAGHLIAGQMVLLEIKVDDAHSVPSDPRSLGIQVAAVSLEPAEK